MNTSLCSCISIRLNLYGSAVYTIMAYPQESRTMKSLLLGTGSYYLLCVQPKTMFEAVVSALTQNFASLPKTNTFETIKNGGHRIIHEATIDLRRKFDAKVRIWGHEMCESARPATLSHTKMSRFKNVTIQIITIILIKNNVRLIQSASRQSVLKKQSCFSLLAGVNFQKPALCAGIAPYSVVM